MIAKLSRRFDTMGAAVEPFRNRIGNRSGTPPVPVRVVTHCEREPRFGTDVFAQA